MTSKIQQKQMIRYLLNDIDYKHFAETAKYQMEMIDELVTKGFVSQEVVWEVINPKK